MNGTVSIGTGVSTQPDLSREDQGSEVVVRFFDEDLGIVAQAKLTLSNFALTTLANRNNVPAEVTLYPTLGNQVPTPRKALDRDTRKALRRATRDSNEWEELSWSCAPEIIEALDEHARMKVTEDLAADRGALLTDLRLGRKVVINGEFVDASVEERIDDEETQRISDEAAVVEKPERNSHLWTTWEAASTADLADHIDKVYGDHERRATEGGHVGKYEKAKHLYAAGQIDTITSMIRQTTIKEQPS